MIRAEASQTIERPIEDVFSFVTDPTNEPRWHTDVLEVHVDPNDGPAPGASSRWVVNFMGQKDMRMRIDELELGRKEVLQATSGPMLPRITYLFEPEKTGTRFTRKVEIQPAGLLRLMEPMIRTMVTRRNATFVGNLKRVLESPAGSFSTASQ